MADADLTTRRSRRDRHRHRRSTGGGGQLGRALSRQPGWPHQTSRCFLSLRRAPCQPRPAPSSRTVSTGRWLDGVYQAAWRAVTVRCAWLVTSYTVRTVAPDVLLSAVVRRQPRPAPGVGRRSFPCAKGGYGARQRDQGAVVILESLLFCVDGLTATFLDDTTSPPPPAVRPRSAAARPLGGR